MLVVFGFAFNPYDKAILRFLGRNGTGIGHVLIIDVEPNVDAAHRLWPAAAIVTTGPESPATSISEWFTASAT